MNQKLMDQPHYKAFVELEARILPLLTYALRELYDGHMIVHQISSALSETTKCRREFEARFGTEEIT